MSEETKDVDPYMKQVDPCEYMNQFAGTVTEVDDENRTIPSPQILEECKGKHEYDEFWGDPCFSVNYLK
jgi:hypothetical protein